MTFTLAEMPKYKYTCLAADNKPTTAAIVVGDLAIETDTGKTYRFNGSTWDLTVSDNISLRRGTMVPSGNSQALSGILSAHTPTGAGSISTTYDTTEGVCTAYAATATANLNAGLVSPSTGVGVGRRLFGMRAMIRAKIDSTTSARYYFGFTSATALPISDTPLAITDHGVIVGWSSTDTTWQIYHNDGATSVTKDAITGAIAKDALFHTIEILWTAAGNVIVIFDGTPQTISADLPATTSNLFFNAVAQTTTTIARTHTIHQVIIRADK
jgi:hypothetical protein